MHDRVGAFYMFCLASEVSSATGAALFCDSRENAELGQALLFESDNKADVTDDLLRAGIQLPRAADVAHISTARIAEFSRHRASERQRFRSVVDGILLTARSATDPHTINDYLDSQRVEIQEAVEDHRAALRELHLGAAHGIATITVPAGVGASLAALPFSPVVAGVLAATGLAISAIACYAETRGRIRKAKRSAPFHYLVSLERELSLETAPARRARVPGPRTRS
jgi:hypothetical protein